MVKGRIQNTDTSPVESDIRSPAVMSTVSTAKPGPGAFLANRHLTRSRKLDVEILSAFSMRLFHPDSSDSLSPNNPTPESATAFNGRTPFLAC